MRNELTTFDFSQVEEVNLANNSHNIAGTEEGELLIGTSSSQSITGFEGDDIIVGKDSNDTLIGGAGNDSLDTGGGSNLLLGNDGDDTLVASNNPSEEARNNVFNGGGADDFLSGAGIDIINGGAGDNRILGEDEDENNPRLNIPESIGIVTSQGVEVIKADLARSRFNVDGSGVTVGVLANSFDRDLLTDITASDDVATGDLPGAKNPNGYNTNVFIIDDSADNSFLALTDEGRALIQIITDTAPGVNILFRTAVKGANDFARGIDELVAAGADVIVDDIGSLVEPFFQDGVVAQAANRAVDAGIPYFSAAGNDNRDSYEAEFRPVTDNTLDIRGLERYNFHDFNPGEEVDILQNFTLKPRAEINLSFQWDEPFASAGGKGASSDLDIFVLDANNNIVALGAESNIGTDALERIIFSNPTKTPAEYKLLIGQDTEAGGEAPNLIKYINFSGSPVEAEYFTNSPTIFGHPNAEGVLAVGASSYQTPTELEPFSSVGVVPILFDEQGNRLPEPEFRQKPNIVAPDNVNTTFFGNFDREGDGFPNFIGTSAAAPYAAGVAALLLDAVPDATPQEIYGALEQTALDLDNPFTPEFDTGYDTATGFGLIQADSALDSLLG